MAEIYNRAPKVLIAVCCCQKKKYRDELLAQRKLWFPLVPEGVDVRAFFGGGEAMNDDEVILDCGDEYEDLPYKVKAIFRWALDHGYDGVWRVDSDVYLRPERLGTPNEDYQGRVRGASDALHPWVYCSGFCYWVSRKAMELLISSKDVDIAEDRLMGMVMAEHGIEAVHDHRLVITQGTRSQPCSDQGPAKDNVVAASCEWSTDSMFIAHEDYERSKPPKLPPKKDPDFSRVDILIKTILRDGHLKRTVDEIRDELPSARMVIMDDGVNNGYKPMLHNKLRAEGHYIQLMNYDSGFGAKSNAAIKHYERSYVLIGSDDFDFRGSADGVRKMVHLLDNEPSIGIVSGRVDGKPYEFLLDEVGTGVVREVPIDYNIPMKSGGITYYPCDLTVNYSMIRRELLGLADDKLHWWSDVKIGGGEHGAFFYRAKRLGIKTVYCEGVSIKERPYFVGCQDARYPGLRGRARMNRERPAFAHEGIREYFCHGSLVPERA